jgi:hypothetical protein
MHPGQYRRETAAHLVEYGRSWGGRWARARIAATVRVHTDSPADAQTIAFLGRERPVRLVAIPAAVGARGSIPRHVARCVRLSNLTVKSLRRLIFHDDIAQSPGIKGSRPSAHMLHACSLSIVVGYPVRLSQACPRGKPCHSLYIR